MQLDRLDHLIKNDFSKLSDSIHTGDWFFHQILEEPNHEDWMYECLLGSASNPSEILQFMPHGGEPQVRYFKITNGDLEELDLTDDQWVEAQAFIDSADMGHPRLAKEEKSPKASLKNHKDGQSQGGCLSLLAIPLVLIASLLAGILS
jgi:hypothetical protein